MTKLVRCAGLLPTVTIGQGCSWEVTTNDEIGDEIGDATIKVSVMMLIMMIMIIMMMMLFMVMLEMLVIVVTVCYAFTHSLGHTVTRSHGHCVTRSLIHSFIHSFVHSLLIHTFPRSCIQWCRLPTINVKIVHWERPISQRALRWHGRCPRSSAWSKPSVIDPLATPGRVRRWRQCMLIKWEWHYRGVLSGDMVDVPDVISVVDA